MSINQVPQEILTQLLKTLGPTNGPKAFLVLWKCEVESPQDVVLCLDPVTGKRAQQVSSWVAAYMLVLLISLASIQWL